MTQSNALAAFLLSLGRAVRDAALKVLRDVPLEERIRVHTEAASDVIYAIDHAVEAALVETLRAEAGAVGGVTVVAEGLADQGPAVYPEKSDPAWAAFHLLIDPLDGTRGLMYEKRSAFFLAGAAPNKGRAPALSDIEAAVMVEIPTTRAYLADELWALRGQGARGRMVNLLTGRTKAFTPRPSREASIEGGFAQLSRFFPPGKDELASIEEELIRTLFPKIAEGKIATFEDQYISSGGQLYELITGKDRFTADLRASLYAEFGSEGKRTGHACHPYDLCAHLIGTEAGVFVTDAKGKPLDGPFDTTTNLDWVGYANRKIQAEVSGAFGNILKDRGLI